MQNNYSQNEKHIKEFKITNWCIENKTTIYIFTLIITLAGLVTYNNLPKERFPDIVIPTVFVSTIYPGTSPQDVENLISKPIEKQLKSVTGIKKITSNSIQDFSAVVVEFNTGIDVALCKQRVADAVDKAKADLPQDLDKDPMVQEVNFSEFPIMNINIAGDFPIDKLKQYADDLKDEMEGLKEITRVDIIGAPEREIQINVDLYRMQAAGISFSDIQNAIAYENINISGGDLNIDNVRRTLRVTGEFKKIQDIENIIVRSGTGNPVFLNTIAKVEDNYKEKQDYARLDNKTVITLNVIKRAGENLINASEKIDKIIEKAKKEKRIPEKLRISITNNQATDTKIQLNDLINSVVIGFVFVVLVLMFFMGTTNAIFVGLAVPLSVLIAFLFMPSLGYSLNIIVLFSLLLGLGIVVDDAIVVVENAHRIYHLDRNIDLAKATKMAAGEVFLPVLTGTITTVAPFFPLLFWPGIVGEFMKYLPVTLILVLFASLFVAYIINPVFVVSFMKRDDHRRKPAKKLLKPSLILMAISLPFYLSGNIGLGNLAIFFLLCYLLNYFAFTPLIHAFQSKVLPRFMKSYRRLLTYMSEGRRPFWFLGGSLGGLVLAIFITVIAKNKVVFFPNGEPKFIYIYNVMPIGTDASVTDSVTKIIEKRVYEVVGTNNPIVESVISNVGIGAGDPRNPDRTVTPHKSKVTIAFVEFAKRNGASTAQYLEKIRSKMTGIAGAEISVDKEQNGPPTGKPIAVEISGEDFMELNNLSKQVKQLISKSGIEGIEDLRSDLQLNKPEISIDINREKASREGVSTAQIAMEIRTALYGREVSQFRDNKDEFPIMVRLEEKHRNTLERLLNLEITFRDARGMIRHIPLASVAKVDYTATYSVINRKNQKRMVTLSSNVLEGYNANEIVAKVKEVIKEIDMPPGYDIKMGGEQEDQAETANFLGFAFLASIGLIFMVLVTQFNSLSKPFIIFFTILLSFIGVLLGFSIFGMTYSIVMTGVGIVALAGIVVKNGILLIEFIEELRKRGYDVKQAVIEAGATRIIPVLLTAGATVLGLIPLAFGININFATLFSHFDPEFFMGGESEAFWGPLAWTIIFGLTFSTFLTLVIVPAMYLIIDKIKQRWKRKNNKLTAEYPSA